MIMPTLHDLSLSGNRSKKPLTASMLLGVGLELKVPTQKFYENFLDFRPIYSVKAFIPMSEWREPVMGT